MPTIDPTEDDEEAMEEAILKMKRKETKYDPSGGSDEE